MAVALALAGGIAGENTARMYIMRASGLNFAIFLPKTPGEPSNSGGGMAWAVGLVFDPVTPKNMILRWTTSSIPIDVRRFWPPEMPFRKMLPTCSIDSASSSGGGNRDRNGKGKGSGG